METQSASQRTEEEGEEHYDTAEDMEEEEEADTMEEASRLPPPSEPTSAPPAVLDYAQAQRHTHNKGRATRERKARVYAPGELATI